MERLSRAESTVIAAGLLLAAALILYHAFDAQPLDPVIEPFSASSTFAAAEQASAAPATEQKPPASTIEAAQQPETRSGPSKAGSHRATAVRSNQLEYRHTGRADDPQRDWRGQGRRHHRLPDGKRRIPIGGAAFGSIRYWRENAGKAACAGLRVNFWRMLQLSVIPIHLKK